MIHRAIRNEIRQEDRPPPGAGGRADTIPAESSPPLARKRRSPIPDRLLRFLAGAALGLLLAGAALADDGQRLLDAARDGDTATVALLLDQGVDVESPDIGGWTPLVWAAAYLHVDTVRVLIESGADLEAIGRAGKNSGTALMWAAKKRGSRDLVELLLDSGAEVDGVDQYGRTALMMAARHGQLSSIRLLIARGADINAVNTLPTSRTALETAKKYQSRRVVRMLRELGAKDWDDLPADRIAVWRAAQ
ncbi:MAG: ankyrin repeat domain-containing protein [Alphaproteobacteria bacterium]|jgi:ankyrin repeat protein|nr:ankyrin repeat domain-containing protein [Alphaproteobacteria bacterium]MDP6516096.1 ankyrin repeat domain-containing protein [Alphaproteobacteria bacterium]